MKVGIEDIAFALPGTIHTNQMLREDYPDWNFDNLETRTGVYERRIAGPEETALDFAEKACKGLDLEGVNGLIFCTETPDHPIPSNACLLHGRLSLPDNVLSLDVNMGCSGFVYCLELARSLIKCGTASKILLATGDTYSRFINVGDRSTRMLFGDGAAVSIIKEAQNGKGIIDLILGSNGKEYERFMVPAGGARQPLDDASAVENKDKNGNIHSEENIIMDGFGVLSFFNSIIPGEVKKLLQQNDLELSDIDAFVFHQSSRVGLNSIARTLKIPGPKMIINMENVGNLVSASIPVSLKMALDEGQINSGDLIVLCGFGVGLSWATALVRI